MKPGSRVRSSTSRFQLYGEARAVLGDGADYLEAIKVIEASRPGVEIRG